MFLSSSFHLRQDKIKGFCGKVEKVGKLVHNQMSITENAGGICSWDWGMLF